MAGLFCNFPYVMPRNNVAESWAVRIAYAIS